MLEIADQFNAGKSFWRWMRGLGAVILGIAGFLALAPKMDTYFTEKDTETAAQKIKYGPMAEDVIKVLPDLVGLDAKGRANSVDLVGLIPIMVKAIAEQQREIVRLRSELVSLRHG